MRDQGAGPGGDPLSRLLYIINALRPPITEYAASEFDEVYIHA
jgi:hypothetical protein